MRVLIFISAFIVVINIKLFGQGGVDIKYIPIDSVTRVNFKQDVKIDFKGSLKKNKVPDTWTGDTISFTIGDKSVELIEIKGRGVDYWYFDKAYLESTGYEPGQILRIYKSEILELSSDSILFRLTIQLYKKKKNKLSEISSQIKDIWISKEMLDGVMIKV